MNPEDVLKPNRQTPDAARVDAIVRRAKRDVVAKDLVEFGAARIWLALLNLAGNFLSFLGRTRSPTSDASSASTTTQTEPEDSP